MSESMQLRNLEGTEGKRLPQPFRWSRREGLLADVRWNLINWWDLYVCLNSTQIFVCWVLMVSIGGDVNLLVTSCPFASIQTKIGEYSLVMENVI